MSDGGLVVSLPQLAVGGGEPALAEATVEVVRSGDCLRLANVLDVVLPGIRVREVLLYRPDRVSTPPDCGPGCARSNGLPSLPRPTHRRWFREPVAHRGDDLPELLP